MKKRIKRVGKAVFLSWVCILRLMDSEGESASLAIVPTASARNQRNNPVVRVLVAEDKKFLNVSIKGSYRIRALPNGQLLQKGNSLIAMALLPTAMGFKLG